MNLELNYKKTLKIICLTEESVETLFRIGRGNQVFGVSSFVKRPIEATRLPKISLFTSSKVEKICEMQPDLVLGYSDIQRDIAKELIGKGLDVWIANHRSVVGILNYIYKLSLLVDAKEEGERLIAELENCLKGAKDFAQKMTRKPKVYFEEWDAPMISAIEWVSEIIELCGGESVTRDYAKHKMALDRVVSSEFVCEENPDIIFGCWCGKKVRIEEIKKRSGWQKISAIQKGYVYELAPEIFLQPGPAVIIDGIKILIEYFKQWHQQEFAK